MTFGNFREFCTEDLVKCLKAYYMPHIISDIEYAFLFANTYVACMFENDDLMFAAIQIRGQNWFKME